VFQRALRPPWWWGARNSIGASTRGRRATASVGERAGGARASQRAAGEDGVSGALACGACRWGRAGPLPAARGLAGRFPRELASMSIGDFLCCFAAAAVDHCLPSVALFRSGWQELDLYGPTPRRARYMCGGTHPSATSAPARTAWRALDPARRAGSAMPVDPR
jgi:hypothetical protein